MEKDCGTYHEIIYRGNKWLQHQDQRECFGMASQDADPDFGSCQAKELLDHLENVVANEPAVVKRA